MAATISDFRVDHADVQYSRLGSCSQAVVRTVISVQCRDIDQFVVRLPLEAMPFGLLDTITAEGAPDFRVSIVKDTGERTSKRAGKTRTVSVCTGCMVCDQDAAHDAFKQVWATTGHDFRFRMIPCESIVAITLEFYEKPPAEFVVHMRGVNTVRHEAYDTAACDIGSRARPVKLGFPPIPPSKRLQMAMTLAANSQVTPK